MNSNTHAEIHAEIAKHLAKPRALSSAQCMELAQKASKAVQELSERVKCIHPKNRSGAVGPERVAALMTGTVDEVVALDVEYARVKILLDQLSSQRDELYRLRAVAGDREASEALPGLLEELTTEVGNAEAARDALIVAVGKLDACMTKTMTARARALGAALPAASGSPALAQRINALRPLEAVTSLRVVNRHCKPFEELGIDRDMRKGLDG